MPIARTSAHFEEKRLRTPEGFNFLQLPHERIPELYRYDPADEGNTFLGSLLKCLTANELGEAAVSQLGQNAQRLLSSIQVGGIFCFLFPTITRNLKSGLSSYYGEHTTDKAPLSGARFLEIIATCDAHDGLDGYKLATQETAGLYYSLLNRMIMQFERAVERSRTGASHSLAGATTASSTS